ncbi:MAG: redoxin domain-containing protein [Clostridiales bacterium]|nr:redoxin domain-containing protein [Clostridiales bacterium]
MKKRLLVFITAAIMLLCTAAFAMVGCGSDAEKLEYSVTVLAPDGNPQKDVTVSWQQSGKTHGSAVTGEDGVATAMVPAGTYKVVLSGMGDGLSYDDISVTSSMREITLQLQAVKITYTATVMDKTGAPAAGVTVTWANDNGIGGTAVTGADGKAECELNYDEYTVTVSNLPNGNIYTDTKTVTGKAPTAVIELRDGMADSYTVTVRSAGGLKLKDVTVFVYSGTRPIYSNKTDANGILAFDLPADNYTVRIPNVQEGYTVTSTPTLTSTVRQGEVVLTSEVILDTPPAPSATAATYVIGDIIHDYEWITPYEVNGAKEKYSIAKILETKQAVVINNWGTECSWCVKEMPAMEEVYDKLKDKIELLAISNYQGGDSEATIVDYRNANGYSFPMMRDYNSFALRFQITGFPTTIIIDRYGAIAHVESGAVTAAEVWERLINKFIGDNYVQTFTPGDKVSESINTEMSRPDITVPADHYEKVTAAINNFTATDDMYVNWYGETKNDMMWPFILKTEEGVSDTEEVLCSSNSKKPNSMSALYATVKMPAGKVLAFDYYSQTETDTDILSAVWDGRMVVKQISGTSGGWKTCYLYAELTEDEHGLGLSYIKNNTRDIGLDNVYIRNVRFEDVSAMNGVDMLRYAAYGTPDEDDTEYPHYVGVELVDGYYHVKLGELENSQYAGNDEKPMLFANMTGVTNWSINSVSELIYAEDAVKGGYAYKCNMTKNGQTYNYRNDLITYCRAATASDIPGFVPVDEELSAMLKAFTAEVEGSSARANAWLELCSFYSHYGEGEYIRNPIIGLTTKTAIPVELAAETTADLTREMAPFPTLIYTFTPEESAVYRIESLLPADSQQAAQVWLYDDGTDPDHALVYSGDNRMVRDGVNEHNFVVYRYLTAGHKYYIEVAFLMQEMGQLDFRVTKVEQPVTELVPCSSSDFVGILGPDGESIIGHELSYAVTYYKDSEGYYRVGDENDKHDDDPYIYLDVKYPTSVSLSFTALAKQNVKVPYQNKYCDFGTFDFRYRIAYSYKYNGANVEPTLLGYVVDYDLTQPNHGIEGREYKDYTAIVNGYIEQSKDTDGLVKVNDEIKDMLTLFIETRVNPLNVYDNGTIEYDKALDNEWLRLCWYYRVYNEQNP